MRLFEFTLATLVLCPILTAQWPQIGWERVVTGLKQPTLVTGAGDGTGRLFVVEQIGRVRILRDGILLEKPFLDLTARAGFDKNHGLFSIAFPPRFAERKHFYANFTDADGNTVIARYKVTEDPNVADPASEELILEIPQPFAQHYGGMMAFSPVDGMLYISTGDGPIGVEADGKYLDDPLDNGQNKAIMLGKILRIDTESGVGSYEVPADNPRKPGWLAENWSIGWRNPWRFSFDRKTGDMYIGDVGSDGYEEIDFEPAGAGGGNYGWALREGNHCVARKECAERDDLIPPVLEYAHDEGCSVTGSVVYRGRNFPELDGTYFFGDFCRGMVWAMKRSAGKWIAEKMGPSGAMLVSFGTGDDGEVFAVDYKGSILRMIKLVPAFAVTAVGNGASSEPGMVPGSLSSIFTAGLPGVTEAAGQEEQPAPLIRSGVTVWVNGTKVPVVSVEPGGKVDFLAPYVLPDKIATVQVRAGYLSSDPFEVEVRAVMPGLFSTDGRMAKVVDEAGENTSGGAPGTVVALFGTGLGPATNPPEFGYPALETPSSEAIRKVTVTMGGTAAEMLYCGLSPGVAGIYTIIVRVPASLKAGDVEVRLAVDGVQSPALQFSVRTAPF